MDGLEELENAAEKAVEDLENTGVGTQVDTDETGEQVEDLLEEVK